MSASVRQVSDGASRMLVPNAVETTLTKAEWAGWIEQRKKDGSTINVEARWSLVRDAGGDPKSILSPTMMSIDLHRMYASDPDAVRIIDMVGASAKRGAEMVRKVLSFARGVEGGTEEVEIAPIFDDLLRIIEETFPKNIRVESRLHSDLWRIRADATQIHQVLLNLSVNARDAMPDGGRISLRAQNMLIDELDAARNIESPVADLPRGRGETVMVVDDELYVRKINCQTLETFGYKVLLAANGPEAVSSYATHRNEISVILADMMMPVMDGPATVRVLRRLNPAVRIIGASGRNATDYVSGATNAGVNHFLPKPYTAEPSAMRSRRQPATSGDFVRGLRDCVRAPGLNPRRTGVSCPC